MNVLAWFLKDLEDPRKVAEAEEVAREAVSLARSALGEEDPVTLGITDTLAVVLLLRGKPDAAILEFERIAAAGLPNMSSVRYGRCLQQLGRYADAERVLLTTHNGNDQSATTALVDLYEDWGKPEKAADYRALLQEAEEVDDDSE